MSEPHQVSDPACSPPHSWAAAAITIFAKKRLYTHSCPHLCLLVAYFNIRRASPTIFSPPVTNYTTSTMYPSLPRLRTVSAVSIAMFLLASASPIRAIPIRIAVYVPAAIHFDIEAGSQLNHDLHAIASSPDIHLDVANDIVEQLDNALHAIAPAVDVHPSIEHISSPSDHANVNAAATHIRPDIEDSNSKSSHHDLDYNHEPHDFTLFHERLVGNAKTPNELNHMHQVPDESEKHINDGVVNGMKISSHNPFRALNHASSRSDALVIQPDAPTSPAEDSHPQ
ncbi:hypothetical protein F5876DRAFT_78231 [Lentinula aff. lateritia]|uniref:Uncharacterized protein n=1 Tax=Lentinula aff. lateritia TaxID=2804960 RepID=A0ACC1TVZ7_9AGAR|nr:hypothetical protein F5876DRAFT_78231 [Lentinula aff. lateritia]